MNRAKGKDHVHLTRRERQIMDVLYAKEEATAAEVLDGLPDTPSYSTVRALLKKLLDKGHVSYRQDGPRYIYLPVLAKPQASANALERVLDTFFGGSAGAAVVSLLGREGSNLSLHDINEIASELEKLKRRVD